MEVSNKASREESRKNSLLQGQTYLHVALDTLSKIQEIIAKAEIVLCQWHGRLAM